MSDMFLTDEFYAGLFHQVEDAILIFSGSHVIEVNQAAEKLLGRSRDELIGVAPEDVSAELQLDGRPSKLVARENLALAAEKGATRFDWIHNRKDATEFIADVWMVQMQYKQDKYFCAVVRDISAHKKNEEELRHSLQKLSLHVVQSPLAVIDWDINFCVTEWNPAAEHIFGHSKEEALGQHASFIIPEAYHEHVDSVWAALLDNRGGARSTNENITKDGKIVACEWYNTPVVDEAGDVLTVTSLVQDASDRLHYINTLQHQAQHDSLTQLHNRDWLIERLETVIEEKTEDHFCLYFVDLDRFKEINDTLGHHIGDEMLITLSQRLNSTMCQRNYEVARLGGDEFAVLASDREIDATAQCIIDTLTQPVELSGMSLEVRAGIGIACYPQHGQDASTLMRCADIAMYHAKGTTGSYETYSEDIDQHSPERLVLMSDLRKGIADDQLRLFYQPKIQIAQQAHVGYEALLRWEHPQRGMVPPNEFIPLAEVTEIIQPLTMWVVEEALRQWSEWCEQGYKHNISINLSTRNLLDESLPEHIARLLAAYKVEASYIELEITESAVMAEPERALDILNQLHDLGLQLSIDDFGTGYSSLAYLRRLPIDKLKIDGSFVMGMGRNHEDRIIVESTIGLAHNLGLRVIAEGVENEALLALLDGLGCDEAQGYFIARPLPVLEIEDWREGWSKY
jgi:diguanylate cyclase (GGDEF)-like protein/PAS domain S-box-containing protein